MPPTCVVKHCVNSYLRLQILWRKEVCPIHNINFGVAICPPPFELFVFPKDDERRRQWVELVRITVGLMVRKQLPHIVTLWTCREGDIMKMY